MFLLSALVSILCLCIAGDDDDSVKLAQSFDDNEVGKVFLHANCVAIKLHIKRYLLRSFCMLFFELLWHIYNQRFNVISPQDCKKHFSVNDRNLSTQSKTFSKSTKC